MQDDGKEGHQILPLYNHSHTPPQCLNGIGGASPDSIDPREFYLIPHGSRGGSRCGSRGGSRCGSRGSYARRGSGSRGDSRCGSRGSVVGSRHSPASRGPSRTSGAPPKVCSRPPSFIGFQRGCALYNEVLAAIKTEDENDALAQDAEKKLDCPDAFSNLRPATVSTVEPPTRGTDTGGLEGFTPGDLEQSFQLTSGSDEGAGEWLSKRKTRLFQVEFEDADLEEAEEDDEDEEDGNEDQGDRSLMRVPKLKPRCGRCPLAPIDVDSARYPNRFLHQISKTSWLKLSKKHDTTASRQPHWHNDADKLIVPPLVQTVFTRKRHPAFKQLSNKKLYHMDNKMLQYKVKNPLLKDLVASLDRESFDFKYRAMREDMELSRMRMIVGKKVRNRTFEDTVALVGYLRKHRFFVDLQIDILHKIGLSITLRRFEVNEVVWRQSQEVQGIYILLRGQLDLQCSSDYQPIELDGDEDYIFVRGEKVLGLRELLFPNRGGPPRLRKNATHSTTAVAAKVVEGLFIEKDFLRSILDTEATAERMKVLKELMPETMHNSTEDLLKPSHVEQDGHPLPIHRLFTIDVFPTNHKFFEKGQKLPWDVAMITLIIEGQVELQLGMQVSLLERGAILGKEPLSGDLYHFTAIVKSEKVRAMQIRVQDYATQYESQMNVIGQLRSRAREARKHVEEKSDLKERKSGLNETLLRVPIIQSQRPPSGQCLSSRGKHRRPSPRHSQPTSLDPLEDMPLSGIQLKHITMEDLVRPTKVEADRQFVLEMHPHASFKKLPPRRMPPIDRPTVYGRTLTEAADDIAEIPTTRVLALKRTARQKSRQRLASKSAQRSPSKQSTGERSVPEPCYSDATALRQEKRAVCTQVALELSDCR